MNDFEIGYIMGLVVGEGSFTGDRRQACLQVKMHERDPQPLRELQRLLGGCVFGPYNHNDRQYYVYALRGRALARAIPLLKDRLPSSWKRQQFEAWLEKYREH
jgi:hypothetical protein